MTEREESIQKIKEAYENKELGFQKGATNCLYFDAKTGSHCAVGVLLDIDELKFEENGNLEHPFLGNPESTIREAMEAESLEEFKGLDIAELEELQNRHDEVLRGLSYEFDFKDYLYNLK